VIRKRIATSATRKNVIVTAFILSIFKNAINVGKSLIKKTKIVKFFCRQIRRDHNGIKALVQWRTH
jgi:hypothetical protein